MNCDWKIEIMILKTTSKMIIDAHQLSWFYHVNYMINELLVACVCGVLGPAELVGRILRDLVQDVVAQMSSRSTLPDGK